MMVAILNLIAHPATQAIFWGLCVAFSVYFAYAIRSMSFGKDVGTKAWYIITIGLFLIGFRVSFKLIFPNYALSYGPQILRYSIGLLGLIILFYGFMQLGSSIRKLYGGELDGM